VANPIDLGAGAEPGQIAAALAIVMAAEEIDMVLAVFTETLVADVELVMAAVTGAAAESDKPIVATQVGRGARSLPVPERSTRLDTARAVPVFSFPEPAAAALGRAWKYAVIRARPPKAMPCHSFEVEGARNLVVERLAEGVEWLAPEDVARLLIDFGVTMAPQSVVGTTAAAVRAAGQIGYPVAVKVVGGPVHKSDTGGVRLNVGTDQQLAEAFVAVTSVGTQLKALIQPMIGQGIEMIVGCVQDAQFGPVVMVGAGGVLADLVADRTFRLAPIDVGEAEQMIDELRTARLLDGYRGMPAVSRPALADLVSRLAALADGLPDVAEIDLNPVICTGDRLIVVDARVRLAHASERPDPMLRQLRPIHA
jgi:acyl-CoA synthetase (NDP forming)